MSNYGLAVLSTNTAIEQITGSNPRGCPWRGVYDDDVKAVQRAHRWHESGQLREWWGDDPEWWLVEGLAIYHAALQSTLADANEQRRKARK